MSEKHAYERSINIDIVCKRYLNFTPEITMFITSRISHLQSIYLESIYISIWVGYSKKNNDLRLQFASLLL